MKENGVFDPEIVVLYCGHCVREDRGIAATLESAKGFSARATMQACSSQVEASHILRILERGVDGVQVIACPPNSCGNIVGSIRAGKRVQYVRAWLDRIGMGAERAGISINKELTADGVAALARERAEAVRPLGPNPMGNGGKK